MKRFPSRPSRRSTPAARDSRNLCAFYAGATTMEQAPNGGKRGPQPEGKTNKAIAEWKTLKNGLFIARNKRRLATPVGWNTAIMLGWEVDGSADWIGWQRVVVTPEMVGQRVAVFVGIEAKREKEPDGTGGGVVSKDQERFLNALTDAGGIAGVARNAQDAEDVLTRWRNSNANHR